jgi:CheY-like chemotaxis protein
VYSGKDCIEVLYDETPDLILMNMTMPELDGFQTLELVRSLHSMIDLPVVLMALDLDAESLAKALATGANDCLEKPINFELAFARVNIQLNSVKNFKEAIKQKEKDSRNSMIATYNHEINNPLTIAYGFLRKAKKENSLEYFDRISETLQRVTNIIKEIEQLAEEQIEKTDPALKIYKRS